MNILENLNHKKNLTWKSRWNQSYKIFLGVLGFSVIKYVKYISIFFFLTEVVYVYFIFTIFTIYPITTSTSRNTDKTMLFATASTSTAWTFLGDVPITSNKTKNIVRQIWPFQSVIIGQWCPLDNFHPQSSRFNSTLIKVFHSITCKWTRIDWYVVALSVGARECGLLFSVLLPSS